MLPLAICRQLALLLASVVDPNKINVVLFFSDPDPTLTLIADPDWL
jgi:hypothetical protein